MGEVGLEYNSLGIFSWILCGIVGVILGTIITYYIIVDRTSKREQAFIVKIYVFIWLCILLLIFGFTILSPPYDRYIIIPTIILFYFIKNQITKKINTIREEEKRRRR